MRKDLAPLYSRLVLTYLVSQYHRTEVELNEVTHFHYNLRRWALNSQSTFLFVYFMIIVFCINDDNYDAKSTEGIFTIIDTM